MSTNVKLAVVVGLAIVLQFLPLRNIFSLVRLGFAIGKNIQPVTDFPYQCRRLEDPRLQACEDMWLSQTTRQLYLACSDPLGRKQWFPTYVHTIAASYLFQTEKVIVSNISILQVDL